MWGPLPGPYPSFRIPGARASSQAPRPPRSDPGRLGADRGHTDNYSGHSSQDSRSGRRVWGRGWGADSAVSGANKLMASPARPADPGWDGRTDSRRRSLPTEPGRVPPVSPSGPVWTRRLPGERHGPGFLGTPSTRPWGEISGHSSSWVPNGRDHGSPRGSARPRALHAQQSWPGSQHRRGDQREVTETAVSRARPDGRHGPARVLHGAHVCFEARPGELLPPGEGAHGQNRRLALQGARAPATGPAGAGGCGSFPGRGGSGSAWGASVRVRAGPGLDRGVDRAQQSLGP